jgi:radical SAM protein with 4Fe4S-binding SPASM domain
MLIKPDTIHVREELFEHPYTATVRLSYVAVSPIILLGILAWACGEAAGYLAGRIPATGPRSPSTIQNHFRRRSPATGRMKMSFPKTSALVQKTLKTLATRSLTIQCDSIPYRFERMSYKRILNWIMTEAAIYRNTIEPGGWPTHVQLEPTSLCNLKCALCPVTQGLHRATGHMEYSIFKGFVDDVGDYLLLMMLWDWGEPLMNPAILDMVRTAHSRGIKTVTSTNGYLLARRGFAEDLVRSGLDNLIVAVDGITQESYSRYRQSGELAKALEGIRCVVEAKKKLSSRTPLVNFRFIPMRHNEHEIPDLVRLASELHVDVLCLKTLNPAANDMYNIGRQDLETHTEFLPTAPALRRFRYDNAEGEHRIRRHPFCKNPWNSPTIHWDGTVSPCTYDYEERFPFGRLGDQSFREIWHGEPYRHFRRKLRQEWPNIMMCGNCSYAFEGGSCWNETIASVYYRSDLAPLFRTIPSRAEVLPLSR